MNCWRVLGLEAGQDAAAIKKAYAARLRTTRPDDDAAAYQQLREAYDAAMAHAKGASQAAAPQPQRQAPPGDPMDAYDAAAQAAKDAPDAASRTQWKVQEAGADPLDKYDAVARAAKDALEAAARARGQEQEPAADPLDKYDAVARAARDALDAAARAQRQEQEPVPDPMDAYDAAAEAAKDASDAAARMQWQDAAMRAQADTIDIGKVVGATLDLWEKHGDEALLAYWPELKDILRSALAQAVACSTAFAKMVLGQPQLALEFVDQLRLYFGWGSDYKRAPELDPHDAAQFKRKLGTLAEQLRHKKLEQEHELVQAAKAAARQAEKEKEQATALRSRFGHLLPFARMVGAGRHAGLAYAMLIGPLLKQQWSDLGKKQRAGLGIEDAAFDKGNDTCTQAMRLRGLLGLAMLPLALAFNAAAASRALTMLPLLLCLWLCHRFPHYEWQENLRWRLYPRAFLEKWIRADLIDYKHSRKFCLLFSLAGFALCMGLTPGLTSHDYRYPAAQGLGALALLLCQWLVPPDGWDANPKVLLPILLFCAAASHAAGVTDVVTLLSLSAFWFAAAYCALDKRLVWPVAVVWMLAVVFLHFHAKEHGGAPTAVPLSFIAPWIVLMLARRESAGFVSAVLALAVLSQPFADTAKLGLWVGLVALAAGVAAALMRELAAAIAARFGEA